MIDTHIHLVPGVDDGADSIEMSLKMLEIAVSEGVDEMVLTPHHNVPMFVSHDIDQQFQLLQETVKAKGIPMTLHLGNEIHLNEESIAGIETGMGRTMGDSSYLLIELPPHHYYPFHEAMLFDLHVKGYQVVLAHVERFRVFRENELKLESLVDKGFYGQITARYVFERKTRAKALKWIAKGYIHIVASDGHNVGGRSPHLKAAYDVVASHFGLECAELLFNINPKRMINNAPLLPVNIERKPFGGLTQLLNKLTNRG